MSTLAGCSFIYTGDNLVGPPDAATSEAGTNEGGNDADVDAGTDVFVEGVPGIQSIDADLAHVYWCNEADGTVMRRRSDGSPPETLAKGESKPRFVAVSSAHVYWTAGKSIRRVPIGGTAVETFTTATEEPSGLAFDRGSSTPGLYWSERAARRIKSRSLGPAGEFVAKDSLDAPRAVGVEDAALYAVVGAGELLGFNGFGGAPIRIELGDTSDVKVMNDTLFFTKPLQRTVVRKQLSGDNKTEAIVLDAQAPSSVATDGSNWVYWAEPQQGRIRRKKL